MKKLISAVAIVILLAGFASYNVWRANQDAVIMPPSAVDVGRQQLHAQLEKAEQRESQIEKQDWDSVMLLRDLIKAHQDRIDKLADNSQAGEILTHDRESVARIQARINDLIAQQAERPPALDANAEQTGSPEQKQ